MPHAYRHQWQHERTTKSDTRPAPACHPRNPAHSPRTRLLPLGTLLGQHVLRRHPAQPQSRLHGAKPRQLPLPLPPCTCRSPHRSRAPANAARRSRQTRLPATGRTGREVPLYHRFAHAERGALHPLSGSHRPHPPAE